MRDKIILAVVVGLVLVACGSPKVTQMPTAIPEPLPTSTLTPPTSTPMPPDVDYYNCAQAWFSLRYDVLVEFARVMDPTDDGDLKEWSGLLEEAQEAHGSCSYPESDDLQRVHRHIAKALDYYMMVEGFACQEQYSMATYSLQEGKEQIGKARVDLKLFVVHLEEGGGE